MQCKDLSTEKILTFLAQNRGTWCTWQANSAYMPSIGDLFPEADDKLVIAKMDQLIRKGYARGCTCGCRGDLEITDKGEVLLARLTQAVK